ncbi:MAG TPA: nickel pincer cofactor biosynthesis protein LarC [Bacteroidales bacterium]|nr:nickel pincer cofactor biosynthesis protein LarC [Bacteroidales bacterium]
MKVLYYDCFSGISGDMNLGAMIDLGIEISFLESQLEKLNVKGWKLEVTRSQRHGIEGTLVDVRQTHHDHHHRHLSDIEKIINGSSLDKKTKQLSLGIFMKVAEAEAQVHGIPVGEVHFHEVGAIDSIVDIVGAAICFNALDVDDVYVSVVELGGGTVKCDHGRLPVPAPATAEIIKGIPSRTNGVGFEATTPTGAAIIATLGKRFDQPAPMKILRTGYGIGHKENPEVPNILRVFLAESTGTGETGHDALLLECNIDDMNPEMYEYVSDKLFAAGASDVFLSNIIMKKGRPGIVLSIICETGKENRLKEIVFTETTTLGIRTLPFKKDTLVRVAESVDTEYGKVRIKRSLLEGKEVSCKPESDDCQRIARETGLPLKQVYNTITEAINRQKKVNDA